MLFCASNMLKLQKQKGKQTTGVLYIHFYTLSLVVWQVTYF